MKNLIKLSRRLSNIKRFQTYNTIKPYSVAEHSYRVAMLCYTIAKGNYTLQCESIEKALFHDLEEAVLGDFPGPIKRRSFTFNKEYDKLALNVMSDYLEPNELYTWENCKKRSSGDVVYLADNLEAFETAIEETAMGNQEIKEALVRFVNQVETTYPESLLEKFPKARAILENLVIKAKEVL